MAKSCRLLYRRKTYRCTYRARSERFEESRRRDDNKLSLLGGREGGNMPWCVQDDIDRDRDRSIPKSPQQPSSGRKPPCRPPPVQESCTWMGKRASPGGAKKNKGGGDVTLLPLLLLLYYYYVHRMREISYDFSTFFYSNPCLPLRSRSTLATLCFLCDIFYRGRRGRGHTQRGV